jgi:hypothetical protein
MAGCPGRGRYIEWAKCSEASLLLTEPSVFKRTVGGFLHYTLSFLGCNMMNLSYALIGHA